MNRKALFRCSFISLVFAALAPLSIALVAVLFGGTLYSVASEALARENGLVQAYFLTAVAVFIMLLIATLTVQKLSPRSAGLAEDENDDREVGEVKWFNVNKGYGFITRDSGEDVFVHFRAIRGKGHRTLAEGQKVRYYIIENERGLQADDVTVIT